MFAQNEYNQSFVCNFPRYWYIILHHSRILAWCRFDKSCCFVRKICNNWTEAGAYMPVINTDAETVEAVDVSLASPGRRSNV